jgi:hypothetical protein
MNESPLEAESALAAFRLAAVRRQFELLPSCELPALAMLALESGLDTPSLRELAGELHPTWADSGPLFERVLHELGIASLTPPQSAQALACHYAEQILSGVITPYEGARRIWWDVANNLWDDREKWQQYSIFVGLASEWEDYEAGRPDYEQGIRDEAKKLLSRNVEPCTAADPRLTPGAILLSGPEGRQPFCSEARRAGSE